MILMVILLLFCLDTFLTSLTAKLVKRFTITNAFNYILPWILSAFIKFLHITENLTHFFEQDMKKYN